MDYVAVAHVLTHQLASLSHVPQIDILLITCRQQSTIWTESKFANITAVARKHLRPGTPRSRQIPQLDGSSPTSSCQVTSSWIQRYPPIPDALVNWQAAAVLRCREIPIPHSVVHTCGHERRTRAVKAHGDNTRPVYL
jgi:hypothetical protein